VLSGYLVTTLLLRERSRWGTIDLRRFASRRALRIFPLYYLVLGLLTVHTFMAAPSPQRSHFFDNWVYFASYTSNWWVDWHVAHPIIFGFAWTLAIEEQFYLLWPPVLRWARGLLLPIAFMSLLLLLSQLVTWPECAGIFVQGTFFRTFCLGLSSSIALGSLLALALDSRWSFDSIHRVLGGRWAAPLAFAAAMLCLALETHHLVFHAALGLWLAACVVRPDHGLRFLLEQRWLRHAGTLSYAAYLTHVVAIGVARLCVDSRKPWLVFLMALPLSFLLAQALHVFVERPVLRLKARFGLTQPSRKFPIPSGAA
jgi:peptidoglycan/LPS O-acetylase OafA/YrhL